MIERTYYCDADDCEGHVGSGPNRMEPACPGWLTVTLSGGEGELHFCTWDCVLKYAAKIEPTEVIPFPDPPDFPFHDPPENS